MHLAAAWELEREVKAGIALRLIAEAAVLIATIGSVAGAQSASSRSRENRFVDSVLARMTLEEKLGQLTQLPGRWGDTGPRVVEGGETEIRSGQVGSFLGVFGAAYTRDMQRLAMQSRMKIPLLFAHDVIHGFRTIFPVSVAEAATWDPVAVERSARIAATEATAAGLHWTFAPMVDVARDPRWGRIVEGAGSPIPASASSCSFRAAWRGSPGRRLPAARRIAWRSRADSDRGGEGARRNTRVAPLAAAPTHELWGAGDADGLRGVDTAAGRLGGLICWEHWMPLARQALHDSGEDIHVAVWPSVKEMHQVASRHYAFEGRCFVLAAGSLMRAAALPPELEQHPMSWRRAIHGSCEVEARLSGRTDRTSWSPCTTHPASCARSSISGGSVRKA